MLNRGRGARLASTARLLTPFLEVFRQRARLGRCFHRDALRDQVFIARQITPGHSAAPRRFPSGSAHQERRAGRVIFVFA